MKWNDVWLIFLGSILTFLATIVVEWIKTGRASSEKSRNFKLIIKQEFLYIKKTLVKLNTVLEYKFHYDYEILKELTKSIINLESLKKDAINLSDNLTQEKYIDLVSEISTWATSVKALQDSFYDEENKLNEEIKLKDNKKIKNKKISSFKDITELVNTFKIRSIDKSTNLIEINRRLDELIKLIEK
jgi:hypothetical protein